MNYVVTPDVVNAEFELGEALLIWLNVRRLWRDKSVCGVFAPMWIFYSAWGIWNMFYYPAIGQNLSFWAGFGTTLGNLTWVSLAWLFLLRERAARELAARELADAAFARDVLEGRKV